MLKIVNISLAVPTKKTDYLNRQPGYLGFPETRGFPSPLLNEFGFDRIVFILTPNLINVKFFLRFKNILRTIHEVGRCC